MRAVRAGKDGRVQAVDHGGTVAGPVAGISGNTQHNRKSTSDKGGVAVVTLKLVNVPDASQMSQTSCAPTRCITWRAKGMCWCRVNTMGRIFRVHWYRNFKQSRWQRWVYPW
jgi:hypothetical protein